MKDSNKDLNPNANNISIPSAGNSLIYDLLAPSVEKRKQEWLGEVDEELKKYIASNKIELEDLNDNQHFIDAVMSVTSLAVKTSEKEKIELFKNIVINAALGTDLEPSVKTIFLNIIDQFSLHHIAILRLINNPRQWFIDNKMSSPQYFITSSIQGLITDAIPILKEKTELINLIWKDLENAGFHTSASPQTMMSAEGAFSSRTSEMGRQFLDFITRHE